MNNVGTGIVGFFDIITGLIIYYNFNFSALIILSFFYIILGIWSIYVNYTKGNRFDWRGIVDVINGLTLFSIYSGNIFSFFNLLAILIAAKGLLVIFLITSTAFERY
jgi:hypothetical protein